MIQNFRLKTLLMEERRAFKTVVNATPEVIVVKRKSDYKNMIENSEYKNCLTKSQIDESIERELNQVMDPNCSQEFEFDTDVPVEQCFKIKIVPLTVQNEECFLCLGVDNTELLNGQKAIMQTKLNKILLASVSHEFRTPLNAINANCLLMSMNQN